MAVERDWEFPGPEYRYVIETSRDGSTWTKAIDAEQGAKSPAVHELATEAGSDVRAVKVTFLGGPGWASVREVRLVAPPPHVTAFRDADGDGVAEEQERLVSGSAFDYSQRPADHTSNGLALGIDGWIGAAIGDFGFMAAEGRDGRKLQLRGGWNVRLGQGRQDRG